MSTVISVENLGKKYLLSHQTQRQPYVALRDVIAERTAALGRKLLHPFRNSSLITHHSSQEEFWALKDVSFEIKQGDRVGIIGRNGAGKSTLLKILSRIVEPTTGRVRIKGRVASLLEVGTGFHPELTGRENIFLNGAILGMTKAEIKKKFDEIVDFAEIEKFLDTPVKRYSSGMYVRLAFAVAAHLEPEILLVDEVLAVGDAQFQKKCLGKMEDVSTKEGRTVLFVSHNMQAIRTLCSDAVLLSGGMIWANTKVNMAIESYHKLMNKIEIDSDTQVGNEKVRRGNGSVRYTKIRIENRKGEETNLFTIGEVVRFSLFYRVFSEVDHLCASIMFRCGKTREIVTSLRHKVYTNALTDGYEGHFVIEVELINIRPKEYLLYFWLGDKHFKPFDVVDDLTSPLVVRTEKLPQELGYCLTDVQGYFDLPSRIY